MFLDNFNPDSDIMKELKIVRQFDAAPEKVFNGFTQPQAMRVWWTEDTEFDIDLRVGGRYTITRKEKGQTFVMKGEYLEVEKPGRLRYTIGMPQFSPNYDTISIDIKPDGNGGTVMTFIQLGKDIDSELSELPQGEASESEKGWQQGFDMMKDAWEM